MFFYLSLQRTLIGTSSDDKVEGIRLSSAFDVTERAWKERFGVQYTYCGCPAPGNTIGERLLRAIGHKSQTTASSQLIPINRTDTLAATHPSDHNSVRFVAHTEQAHKVKTQKYDNLIKEKTKVRQEAAKKASKAASQNMASAPGVKAGNDKVRNSWLPPKTKLSLMT